MTRTGRTTARKGLRSVLAGAVAVLTAATMSGCTIIEHLGGSGTTVAGADTSDVADNLKPYYEQAVAWSDCEGRECATITAPLNWDDPSAGDIQLAAVRLPAQGEKVGSLFTNPGGPGASGYDFVYDSGQQMFSQQLQQRFDIVGWDPRGVGRSSAVDCYDDKGMDEFLYGVTEPMPTDDAGIIALATEQAKAFADACAQNTGPLLEFVDTASTVRDLDLLRALVGDEQLNYLGFSYGTDVGAQYADRFPTHVGRMVLDGATDPSLDPLEVILAQQKGFSAAARAWLEDCLAQGTKCPFRGTVDSVIAQINDLMAKADERLPKNGDGRRLTSSVIDTAISAALYSESSWPVLTQAFSKYLRQQDPSDLFMLSDFYYDRDETGHYTTNMFEAFFAINCIDYPVETDAAAIADANRQIAEASEIGVDGPEGLGDVLCEQWPYQSRATPHAVTAAGANPIVVVGTTGDPATPYEWAQAVSEQLESGVLLTYEGEGHIAYDEGDACVNDAINHYLVSGEPPADGTTC